MSDDDDDEDSLHSDHDDTVTHDPAASGAKEAGVWPGPPSHLEFYFILSYLISFIYHLGGQPLEAGTGK